MIAMERMPVNTRLDQQKDSQLGLKASSDQLWGDHARGTGAGVLHSCVDQQRRAPRAQQRLEGARDIGRCSVR